MKTAAILNELKAWQFLFDRSLDTSTLSTAASNFIGKAKTWFRVFRANKPFAPAPYIPLHFRMICMTKHHHFLESNATAHYTPGLGTLETYGVVCQVDTIHGCVCHQCLCEGLAGGWQGSRFKTDFSEEGRRLQQSCMSWKHETNFYLPSFSTAHRFFHCNIQWVM